MRADAEHDEGVIELYFRKGICIAIAMRYERVRLYDSHCLSQSDS